MGPVWTFVLLLGGLQFHLIAGQSLSSTTNTVRVSWEVGVFTTTDVSSVVVLKDGASVTNPAAPTVAELTAKGSYNISSLEAATLYRIVFQGVLSGGSTRELMNKTKATKPTVPTSLTSIKETTDSIQLQWTSSTCGSGQQQSQKISYIPSGTSGTATVVPDIKTNPYTVESLNPGTSYDFSLQNVCGAEESEAAPVIKNTKPTAATFLTDTIDTNNIQLGWSHSSCGSSQQRSYKISYKTTVNPGIPTVKTDTSNSYTVSLLTPGTSYDFTLITVCGGQENAATAVTKITTPGVVQDFSKTKLKPFEVTLVWKPPLAKNGILTLYTVSYQYEDNGLIKKVENISADKTNHTVKSLIANTIYTFYISASTLHGAGRKTNITFITPFWAPAIDIQMMEPIKKHPNMTEAVTHSTISLYLVNPFKETNGKIVGYSIIVTSNKTFAEKNKDRTISTWSRVQGYIPMTYQVFDKCPDLFSNAKVCGKGGNAASRRKRSTASKTTVFKLGDDNNCNEKSEDYCNGPLRPETTFFIKLRAFTMDAKREYKYTDSPYSEAIRTGQLTSVFGPLGLLGGMIALGVLLLAFLVVIIFMSIYILRRRKETPKNTTTDTLSLQQVYAKAGISHDKDHQEAEYQEISGDRHDANAPVYENTGVRTRAEIQMYEDTGNPYERLKAGRQSGMPSAVYESLKK